MSRTKHHDTPYRDDPSPRSHHTARDTSSSPSRRPARPQSKPQQQKTSQRKTSQQKTSQPPKSRPPHDGARPAHQVASRARGAPSAVAAEAPARARSARRRSARRRGKAYAASPAVELTSHPTSRNAYSETRAWLLATHGPVCAYCARRFTPQVMTLDHVQPRRGQTAYDRRDNLVLACPTCNAAKRDLAPLAFLLGARARAANLLQYGAHLSPGLVELARSLVPAGTLPAATPPHLPPSGDFEDDGESPYRD